MRLDAENRHIVGPSIITFIASLILFASVAMADSADMGIKLLHGQGKIQSQKPGSDGWLKVDSLSEIAWGDKIRTREYSAASLKLGPDGNITLGPATVVKVTFGSGDSALDERPIVELERGEVSIASDPDSRGVGCRVILKKGQVEMRPRYSDLHCVFRILVGSDTTVEIMAVNGWLTVTQSGTSAESDSLNRQIIAGYFTSAEQVGREWSERSPIIRTDERIIIASSGTIVNIGRFKFRDRDLRNP